MVSALPISLERGDGCGGWAKAGEVGSGINGGGGEEIVMVWLIVSSLSCRLHYIVVDFNGQ